MPRGSKDKYTAEQKRKAEHIEDSYEHKGVSKDEAEARAWATVNKQSGAVNAPAARDARNRRAPSPKIARNHPDAQWPAVKAFAQQQGFARYADGGQLDERSPAKKIPGRSSMRKQELIEALRKAG